MYIKFLQLQNILRNYSFNDGLSEREISSVISVLLYRYIQLLGTEDEVVFRTRILSEH